MAIMTLDCLLNVLICVSLGVLGIYLYYRKKFNYWNKRGIKVLAKPTCFFGNIASCLIGKKSPQALLLELYRKSEGDQMTGFYVFNKPYLMVRDPELIKHIFIKDFNNFSNKIVSGDERDEMGRANLFLVKDPPWKYIRHKLTPIFTSGKLKKMYDLMMEISQDLETYLNNLDIDDKIGKPIEVKELSAKFTTDLIGTTAFGMSFNSLKNPDAEFRKHGKDMFRTSFYRYLQLLSIFFIPSLRPYTNTKFFDENGTAFFKKTFWEVINARITSGNKRADLIDLLIEIKNKQENDDSDNFKFEGDMLVAQASIFYVGGFETSSTSISFALYELARNSAIQTKLRNEILNSVKNTNGVMTYEMITTLPYLNMVAHEVLRLYPILAWLDRLPEEDYTFPGTDITVEKGTPLILPMRAMHMDPNYFPDPEKFDPERFSEENKNNINPYSYFPFGQGPRSCIGNRLGLIQIKLGIVNFLSKYEITPSKRTPLPIKFENVHVLMRVAGNLYLNFRKIST